MLLSLFTLCAAWNCAPADVQSCLVAFEAEMHASCAAADWACQCERVLARGVECFDGCPDEALDEFISNYADGVCQKAGEIQLTLSSPVVVDKAIKTGGAESAEPVNIISATKAHSSSHTSRSHPSHSHSSHSTHTHSSVTLSLTHHPHAHSNATQLELEEARVLLANYTSNSSSAHAGTGHDASSMETFKWSLLAMIPISFILIII